MHSGASRHWRVGISPSWLNLARGTTLAINGGVALKTTLKMPLDAISGLVDDGLVTVVDPPAEDVSEIIARNAHLFTSKAEPPSLRREPPPDRRSPSLTRLLAALDPDDGDSEVITIPRREPIRSPGLPRPPGRRAEGPPPARQPLPGGNIHELPTMMLNTGPPPTLQQQPAQHNRVMDIDTLLTIPAAPRPQLPAAPRKSRWARLWAWVVRVWTGDEPVELSPATMAANEQAVSGGGRPQLAGPVPVHVRAR